MSNQMTKRIPKSNGESYYLYSNNSCLVQIKQIPIKLSCILTRATTASSAASRLSLTAAVSSCRCLQPLISLQQVPNSIFQVTEESKIVGRRKGGGASELAS